MIELTPEIVVIAMVGGLLVGVMLGYPISFALGGTALIVGFLTWGSSVLGIIYDRTIGIMANYTFVAAPLFIFMGLVLEKSGIANKLYSALHLCLGGFRGGLAIATILIGTVMAACVGIIAASVIMLGIVALPAMVERGYSKDVASGAVCAGGVLGILIPPSIMLILYGPNAVISVGKLFMAAFIPGLLLSGLYIAYLVIRCYLRPEDGPPIPVTERAVPARKKLFLLATSLIPPALLIFAVLGSIFAGIATPTEAAAVGATCALILAVLHRSFSWKQFIQVARDTLISISMVMFIAIGAAMFTGVFLAQGGGGVVSDIILAAPFGRWGAFAAVMLMVFILGMFIDWVGIIFIMVPLVTPIGESLGFDKLWFAMMIIINLQMSFLTPPFAYAIFYLKGTASPELGVETSDIIRGVIPFVLLIMVGLGLCIAFPQIILWLPSMMIK